MAQPTSRTEEKSTIKNVNPIIGQDGKQASYTHPKFNTTNYDYIIEFENGDKGKVSSTKEGTYTYPVGKEVTYTKNIYDNKPGVEPFIIINNVKPLNEFGGSKSTYNNPENVIKMAKSIAFEKAINVFEALGKEPTNFEQLQAVADYFSKWIIEKGTDRDVCSNRWYSLEQAIKMMSFTWAYNDSQISMQITAMAEKIYSYVSGEASSSN